MELPKIKVQNWTVETAQMKHTARQVSMAGVAQNYRAKLAAELQVEEPETLLKLLAEKPAGYDLLKDNEREFVDIMQLAGAWAVIAGCIRPYIPLDEWLSLDYQTIAELSNAAEQINPHWFRIDEKKSSETPQELSTDLLTS